MNIAFVMPTIRSQAARVATAFLDDAISDGILPSSLSFYFSIDAPLSKQDPILQLPDRLVADLRIVRYIDQPRRMALADVLEREGQVPHALLARCLVEPSYASARNAALLEALMDNNDYVLSIDDDVLPLVPHDAGDGAVVWESAAFTRTHLEQFPHADVTRGHYLGYASPIIDLSTVISAECRAGLGLALSLGNEVLKFGCLEGPETVRLATAAAAPFAGWKSMRRGHVIYGGNVGISVRALREGRVPPFYCPPQARGDDTFFGAHLASDATVADISAPVFHDPFRLYPALLDGQRPGRLEPLIPPADVHIGRFAAAFRGWIAYAPLFVRCEQPSARLRADELNRIDTLLVDHRDCLGPLGLNDVADIFRHHVDSMETDFREMEQWNHQWRVQILPAVQRSVVRSLEK